MALDLPENADRTELLIVDISGQLLLRKELNNKDHLNRFDLTGYANGAYFVIFKVNGEIADQKKVIVN